MAMISISKWTSMSLVDSVPTFQSMSGTTLIANMRISTQKWRNTTQLENKAKKMSIGSIRSTSTMIGNMKACLLILVIAPRKMKRKTQPNHTKLNLLQLRLLKHLSPTSVTWPITTRSPTRSKVNSKTLENNFKRLGNPLYPTPSKILQFAL